MIFFEGRKKLGVAVLIVLFGAVSLFLFDLSAPSFAGASAPGMIFEIQQGQGFRTIVGELSADGLIRSRTAFELFSLLAGRAFTVRPGLYRLSSGMGAPDILRLITGGSAGEVTVRIPEGANIFQVDKILSDALVIRAGTLISYNTTQSVEGKLFPDTYNFYTGADVKQVVDEMTANWDAKAGPLLAKDKNAAQDLILASILEKEVPSSTDQSIVAGILLKRIASGIPLDVDAAVCYAKLMAGATSTNCYPLTPLDFKIKSAYNTYLNKGLPPGPIGSPGTAAIAAALHPKSSPYWYYLSDPATGKTIYAKTLDEQSQNRVKYLVR